MSIQVTEEQSRAVLECRSCGGGKLEAVLDLGSQPLANALVRDPAADEARYPLAIALCLDCALVQTTHWVSGEVLFGQDYPYYSSFSTAYLSHAEKYAEELIDTFKLGPHSRVIELASNDGYLLRTFFEQGIPVLGIDPAEGPAEVARAAGIPTLTEYFGEQFAERLREEGQGADVIIGNNVLAHVDDVNDFVAGVAALLKTDGVGVFEVPYLVDLVEKCAFDTIYHEHGCYFSLGALSALFRRHGLNIHRVCRLPVHGGSLRVTVKKDAESLPSVTEMLAHETQIGVGSIAYYRDFRRRVDEIVRSLNDLLRELKGDGNRVAAYGAAAKATVLGNAAGLGSHLIEYVVDRNPKKQGRFLPGIGIPIVSPERLREDPPDFLLLFPWNLADEIRGQLSEFEGRYIVPIPTPRVL